jgi:hypothetical protein
LQTVANNPEGKRTVPSDWQLASLRTVDKPDVQLQALAAWAPVERRFQAETQKAAIDALVTVGALSHFFSRHILAKRNLLRRNRATTSAKHERHEFPT